MILGTGPVDEPKISLVVLTQCLNGHTQTGMSRGDVDAPQGLEQQGEPRFYTENTLDDIQESSINFWCRTLRLVKAEVQSPGRWAVSFASGFVARARPPVVAFQDL
jgi:hypothetical protein